MLFYFLTKQWSYIAQKQSLFVYENEKRMDKGQYTNKVLLSNTSLWNLPIFHDDTCDKLTKQFLLEVWYTVEKTVSRQETTGKFFLPKSPCISSVFVQTWLRPATETPPSTTYYRIPIAQCVTSLKSNQCCLYSYALLQ